jgi:hypothetical protein
MSSDREPNPDPRLALALARRQRGSLHAIETVLLASTACLLAAVAWPIATRGLSDGGDVPVAAAPEPASAGPTVAVEAPTIQLALLLDTSSSMDGLIDQARSQLWQVANTLDAATFQDAKPRLEIAVYEYGNDRLDARDGHLRRVVGFTSELDEVSRALFSLRTSGGSEHAPQALDHAATDLQWRDGPGVLRVIYVAGNETFQQGPVTWVDALDGAARRGIVVNTIFCGPPSDLDAGLWQAAAVRGHGRHFTIDQSYRREIQQTPFDEEIGRLGVAINSTYLGYGSAGRDGIANQAAQDDNSVVAGSLVERGLSKGSGNYRNPSWDLVDAVDEGVVDLSKIDEAELPDDLKGLDVDARAAEIERRRADRTTIATRLGELRRERAEFLSLAASDGGSDDGAGGTNSLDAAMVAAITEQAQRAGFTLAPR